MSNSLWALALQQDDTGIGGVLFGASFFLVFAAIGVFVIASMWIVFTKAGEPGWAILVPIYNAIVMLRIAGKEWWWIFLFLIPIVNIIVSIIVAIAIARNFGKGTGFGLGLAFLGVIFYPILAFGDATYQRA